LSDLEAQKRLWGRDGLGIAGANPNYAARVGISAVVVLIVLGGAFVLLTGTHTPTKAATQYVTDVANGDALQLQLDQAHSTSSARSSIIVHSLVQTLLKEDRRLSIEHWPARVEGDVETLVTINQQISVLNKNTLASSPERAILLTPQNNDASRAADCDSLIRVTLGLRPQGSQIAN
jgi:hypothetical protein